MMIETFLQKAKDGEPIYITDVKNTIREFADKTDVVLLLTLIDDSQRRFDLPLPTLNEITIEEKEFIQSYLYANVYNILSALGGKIMHIYADTKNKALVDLLISLNAAFDIWKNRIERQSYGRCINVMERMVGALSNEPFHFSFSIKDIKDLPKDIEKKNSNVNGIKLFKKATQNLEGKKICGVDIGGSDIKVVMVSDGQIVCYKEFDWFPASFTESSQLIEPICTVIELVKAKMIYDTQNRTGELDEILAKAMDNKASYETMKEAVDKVRASIAIDDIKLDAIGMCFPDVVVCNKIAGGEVYKTRGIRNNSNIEYEEDYAKLTHLNERLKELVKKGGAIEITNDGPMASFTAAVEMVAAGKENDVKNGVFALALGTELGTGWVDEKGEIPEIPLEVYNFIIDLGSFPEKQYEPDDLRSINNFNTGLAGTLQKFVCQSGVFRLAMKYLPEACPEIYKELFDMGFIVEKEVNGKRGFYVPTEPKDMRKPFLEHMMMLVECKKDETIKRIFREIGESIAVTWFETEEILQPKVKSRILFGRLVKKQDCYQLIYEGARSRKPDIIFNVADGSMAHTQLMKQLEEHEHFTVAQFAQAVGAVFYGNRVFI